MSLSIKGDALKLVSLRLIQIQLLNFQGVTHYCVPNMLGVVSRTSTYALTNLTLNYAVKIAQLGLEEALTQDPYLRKGLNTYDGHVCYEPVAQDLGYDYVPFSDLTPTKKLLQKNSYKINSYKKLLQKKST